jgi:hypothetical protein
VNRIREVELGVESIESGVEKALEQREVTAFRSVGLFFRC